MHKWGLSGIHAYLSMQEQFNLSIYTGSILYFITLSMVSIWRPALEKARLQISQAHL